MASLLLHKQESLQVRSSPPFKGEGPIPGVTVLVKGTTIGAITDANGKYSITVPSNATTLIFSYIGMKSTEVEIRGRTVIDGVLQSDLIGLNEVVVTALGIPKEKKALGYSVQDVKGEEIAKAKETNVINSLQGRVSGAQITLLQVLLVLLQGS